MGGAAWRRRCRRRRARFGRERDRARGPRNGGPSRGRSKHRVLLGFRPEDRDARQLGHVFKEPVARIFLLLRRVGVTLDRGAALVEHPAVKAISFTGGTATGRHLAATAAPLFKKLSLELGGKNPNIVFADCDLAAAVATSIRSSFANQGQICLCGSRLFIERPIYEAFKTEFLRQLADQTIGDPLDATTKQGALVSEAHLHKVLAYIELAHAEGGTLLAGGHRATVPGRCAEGFYLEPTVFENLPYDCRTNQEEIFGPVVTLTPFDTEAEALHLANSTEYGLSATIWTRDLARAHRLAHALHSGVVWVNTWLHRDLRTPFGGMKNSGVGREGGLEALRFFTEAQNVCISLIDAG